MNKSGQSGTDPKRAIEKEIRNFVRTSPQNRLESFDNEPIYEAPLIGFADGDDPLFIEYKKIAHPDHLTPREAFEGHFTKTAGPISVVSFVLPINRKTISCNGLETEGPALRWNHTRWKGQDFITALSRHLVSFLEEMGIQALVPDLTPQFKIINEPGIIVSNWSQRHMAYAAGLGTFSLNDGLITRKGIAMRCGSIVVGVKLAPSPRPYSGPFANCLFKSEGRCGICMKRCPGGAISEKGHDKHKCLAILFESQKPWLEGAHGPGYIGPYAGCGLCQTGVPCETRIPAKKRAAKKTVPAPAEGKIADSGNK